MQVFIQPSLEEVREAISISGSLPIAPNVVPLCATIPADFLTPSLAYIKISAKLVNLLFSKSALFMQTKI